jgi:hypothetical protein
MSHKPEAAFALVLEKLEQQYTPGTSLVPGNDLTAAAEYVAANEQAADTLLTRLFPSGVPTDTVFHRRLAEFQVRFGSSQEAALLAAEISVQALSKMEENARHQVLKSLVVDRGRCFFEALRPMPTVITKIRFSPDFVMPWLLLVRQRLGGDLMQGDFWRTVQAWSSEHPDDALVGLRRLIDSSLEDDTISIAACILGSLRVGWESKSPSPDGCRLEDGLQRHTDINRRLVFHRSWINTGWQRKLTTVEFITCLTRMSKGRGEERAEGFNFFRHLVQGDNITPEALLYGSNWLAENSNPSIAEGSKYWVVNTTNILVGQKRAQGAVLKALFDSLVAIQPVEIKNAGIWQQLEAVLVSVLQSGDGQFAELLIRLVDANPDGMIHYFTAPRTFEWLLSEMARHTKSDWRAALFFSPKRHRRRLAFVLFDEIPFEQFPDGMLARLSDDEIALALLEFQLNRLLAEQILEAVSKFI